MKQLNRMIYISSGHIPSIAANAIQTMKMSEAFSRKLPSFELVTLGDLASFLKRDWPDLWQLYGIKTPFRVTRLPFLLHATYPIQRNSRPGFYPLGSVLYALIKRPSYVYTRNLYIAGYAMHLGMKVIVETHEPDLSARARKIFFHSTKGELLQGLIANSVVTAEYYFNAGLQTNMALIVPNGVDIESFEGAPSKESARRSLGLPLEAKISIYVGHLYKNRGIEDIFYCAQALPDVQYLLVGGYEKDIQRRRFEAEQQRLSNVRTVGFVPHRKVPTYLAAADVLLMPYSRKVSSVHWMTPMKMFEYMASRRAILATDLEGIRQVLRDRHNAILVPPDDGQALTNGLKTLFHEPLLMERLASQAYLDVQQYTWDRRAERILQFIEQRL